MNRVLRKSFRGRTYTDGSDYLLSDDDITDNEEKQNMVALLKECGKKYVDQITSNDEIQNHDDETQLPDWHFEDLADEGVSCISESIEVLTTSEENDNDCLSEDADDQSSTKINCFMCAKVTRVDDGTILKAGSHVKFGKFVPHRKTNDFLKKHLKDKLGFPYYHHAIVTEIHMQSKQKVSFKAIEFTTTNDDDGKTVVKVVENFFENFDVEKQFMYVVDYKQLPFTADEIVARARRFNGYRTYALFTNNCEHFALWCLTDVRVSFQSDNTVDAIQNWVTWFSAMMAKFSHITAISKDIAYATKSLFVRVSAGTLAASIGCPIVCAIVECIFLIRRLRQLKNHLKWRLICLCCFNSKKLKIMAKLVIGFIVSIVLLIPTAKYALPVLGFSLLALVVLPWACEKIITKIKAKINPTSVIPQMVVHSVTDITPGDILSVSTGFTTHDVVVEQVKLLPRTVPLNTASMDIVHYTFRGIFGTRTATKEHLNVNLEKESLYVYDFPTDQTFSPEIVISRAEQRLGEQMFNMFTRRSSHMAWECKVLQGLIAAYTKRLVKSADEVHAGDIIEYKHCWLPHAAVVVDTNMYTPADVIELKYVHVDENGNVVEGSKTIDLEKGYVYVQIYDKNETAENAEVVRKAKQHIGEKVVNWKLYKSSHFALSCKLKTTEEDNNKE